MIINTIKCSVSGCKVEHTEESFNVGHPGWGSVLGRRDNDTGEESAHLCPKHLDVVFTLVKQGDMS